MVAVITTEAQRNLWKSRTHTVPMFEEYASDRQIPHTTRYGSVMYGRLFLNPIPLFYKIAILVFLKIKDRLAIL